MGPAHWGKSCEGGKFPTPWEVSSVAERACWMEVGFGSLRRESSNQSVEDKRENNLPRGLAPLPCTSQPEIHLCW